MPPNNSDRDWEVFGRTDPYFAVLTAPEYHGQLSEPAREKFFASGRKHVEAVLSIIRDRLHPSFHPARTLDFGCGVGRLVLPLASLCDQVVGVDVSEAMLDEARRNCAVAGVTNVELVKGDDQLSRVSGSFDFIHSYIVLQHIPVKRGEQLVSRMTERLSPGGVCMFHITYDAGLADPVSRLRYWVRVNVPVARRFLNLARGRTSPGPLMQMNEYSLTRMLDLLRRAGCGEVHVRFSDHGGVKGALIFARKSDPGVFD